MNGGPVTRRDFVKLLSLGGAAVGAGMAAPSVVGTTPRGILLASADEYGGFTVEQSRMEGFPYRCDHEVLKAMSAPVHIATTGIASSLMDATIPPATVKRIRMERRGQRRSRTLVFPYFL